MPHFEAEAPDSPGFDNSEDKESPWLIVPAGGSRKVRLRESAGYDTFDYDKSRISIQASPGPDRLIEVTGKTSGATYLLVKNKRGDGCNLQIRILDKQQVKVALFFATDTANHSSKRALVVALLTKLLQDASEIIFPQTNVEIVKVNFPTPRPFNRDLGPAVEDKDPLRKELAGIPDFGARLKVLFVWDLADGDDGGLFFRQERCCLIKDELGGKDGQALAHEIGHGLLPEAVWKKLDLDRTGHSSDRRHLMYAYFDVAGTKIPYRQALAMNEAAAKP